MNKLYFLLVGLLFSAVLFAETKVVKENGFDNCIEITNGNVRVVLVPYLGGRVLKYEINGNNILYVDKSQNGLTARPEGVPVGPSAGRFDFGPVRVIPKHDNIWWGKWTPEITGEFSAKMTSVVDTATGVQLVREFTLSSKSSKLICKQTIINKSNDMKRYCYWGRTFVKGGGVTYVPLNPSSRYPKQYISYENKRMLIYPQDSTYLTVEQNVFMMNKRAMYKKYVMDGNDGWLAYYSKDNLLFVKKFMVYPDKIYGEMTACTMSVWFNKDKMVEIEPMGPWEWIAPGEMTEFTEEWFLLEKKEKPSSSEIKKIVSEL